MKKNTLGDLQTSDVSSVGILDTRELPQKYITLDELVSEVLPLLSRYAPNIIGEIQAFTDLDVPRRYVQTHAPACRAVKRQRVIGFKKMVMRAHLNRPVTAVGHA